MAHYREPPPQPPDFSLAQARAESFAKLGVLDDRVLAKGPRLAPNEGLVPWPSLTVGKVRVIRRAHGWMVITDGLSDPWDTQLHGENVPPWRFSLELAMEVPRAPEDEGPPPAWVAPLVMWVANWLVEQRFDLRTRLRNHLCLTLGALPVAGLEGWRAPNGLHGLLLGVPFVGTVLGSHAVIARDGDDPVWLLPMKLLHPAEYAWALEVRDASRATWLVQSFLQYDRHISRTDRGPIIGG